MKEKKLPRDLTHVPFRFVYVGAGPVGDASLRRREPISDIRVLRSTGRHSREWTPAIGAFEGQHYAVRFGSQIAKSIGLQPFRNNENWLGHEHRLPPHLLNIPDGYFYIGTSALYPWTWLERSQMRRPDILELPVKFPSNCMPQPKDWEKSTTWGTERGYHRLIKEDCRLANFFHRYEFMAHEAPRIIYEF